MGNEKVQISEIEIDWYRQRIYVAAKELKPAQMARNVTFG